MCVYWEIDSAIIVSEYLLGLLLSYVKIYSICYEGVQLKIQTFQGVIRNKILGVQKESLSNSEISIFFYQYALHLCIYGSFINIITFQHR